MGIFPLESSAMGGRKLAEMRFIEIRLEVAISYQIRVAIVIGHPGR
jgi:hypothetical protein